MAGEGATAAGRSEPAALKQPAPLKEPAALKAPAAVKDACGDGTDRQDAGDSDRAPVAPKAERHERLAPAPERRPRHTGTTGDWSVARDTAERPRARTNPEVRLHNGVPLLD